MPSADAAAEFLSTLNGLHPSLTFTMELPVDTRSLLSALKSSRTELNLKLKFTFESNKHWIAPTLPKSHG